MIIADTSAWIDYVRGVDAPHTDVLDRELEQSRIATGDIIIAEFLQGFREEKDFEEGKKIMEALQYYDLVGQTMALQAAQNYRILRKNGITLRKTVDLIIGTFCIENGFALIHNDKDFDPMERILGLRVMGQ